MFASAYKAYEELSPSMKTYLVGGGDIPLNDAGKKKYAENQAGLKQLGRLQRTRENARSRLRQCRA